jgi:hypothetical protein
MARFVIAAFVVTNKFAHLFSIAAIVGALVMFHSLLRLKAADDEPDTDPSKEAVRQRRRGIKSLVMGFDGRASTSKTQAVLWTFAVLYALTFLLLWGRSSGCGSPPQDKRELCQSAADARDAFTGLMDEGLKPAYYVLLGFPFAAALAAKAMTQAKTKDKTLKKPRLPEGTKGVTQGLAEIVSNDKGESDLMDFQYFAFNLLALTFFFLEFLPNPTNGLPNIPGTLLSLSGLSTATYTTKKALESGPDTDGDAGSGNVESGDKQ